MTEGTPRPAALVIDDEAPMRRLLRTLLESHGFRVTEAGTAAAGVAALVAEPADVVLLDLGLPDGDGLDVTRRIREWSSVPILVLSARGSEQDKVVALDAGADDYLTKPFGAQELLARIRAALRRVSRVEDGQTTIAAGDLVIDLAARRVVVRGAIVHLTPIEYRLLVTLARHAGRVMTHRQLLKEVWGANAAGHPHYVRVFMAALRRKIEIDPARPRHLLTESGVGYRFASEPSDPHV